MLKKRYKVPAVGYGPYGAILHLDHAMIREEIQLQKRSKK